MAGTADGPDHEILAGGVANAGAVVRIGDFVHRPANPHSASIHTYLRALREAGFDAASNPVGFDDQGREQLHFIPGDVAIPPFPAWAQAVEAIESAARLLRQMHDASVGFAHAGHQWSKEMADPQARNVAAADLVMSHSDLCLENIVFRDGEAVAFLDFDFVAPGRRAHDVAAFARMCVPIDDDTNATKNGWKTIDRQARLRAVVDAYGLDGPGRAEVIECLHRTIESGGEFVRRRVEAGEPGFVKMWADMGGAERFDRRREWWITARPSFEQALGL